MFEEIVLCQHIYTDIQYCWGLVSVCDLDLSDQQSVYRLLIKYHLSLGALSYQPNALQYLRLTDDNMQDLRIWLYSNLSTMKVPIAYKKLILRSPFPYGLLV